MYSKVLSFEEARKDKNMLFNNYCLNWASTDQLDLVIFQENASSKHHYTLITL